MNSLAEIRNTLNVALGSPALFNLVNARIALKTGVDLAVIQPDADQDPASIGRVLSALESMGYSSASLRLVAKRKHV